jgi:nucleotide-binding universal stress UspA family protein
MRPFKSILVPTDFSAGAALAVELARDLGRRFGASVTLLHVLEPPAYPVPPGGLVYPTPDVSEDLRSEAEARLAQLRQQVESDGGPPTSTTVREGLPQSEIVDTAARGGFDLIVMGTEGRTGLRRALIGSVAERVVRRAPCPVLTVRPSGHPAEARV